MKKLFSSVLFVLCLAVALLPATAKAESPQAQWGLEIATGQFNWLGSGDFSAAIAAANASSYPMYIQLLSEVEENSEQTLTTDQDVTIDLNAQTLSGNFRLVHTGSGTLTVTDKNWLVHGKISSSAEWCAISIKTGKLIVENCTVESSAGMGIYHEGTGKITVQDASVTGLRAAIYLKSGEAETAILEISNAIIESTESIGVENHGSGSVKIMGGTSLIRGSISAMNCEPDLSSYAGDLKVTASTLIDGSDPVHTYYPDMYNDYKYLKFGPAPYVVRIGSNSFTSLQKAIDAITEDGQTIDLIQDINLAWQVSIGADNDKSFTLNLNNHKIDSAFRAAIVHAGSGTLTITDLSQEGGGVITSNNNGELYSHTIQLSGGSLVVSDCLVESKGSSAAIYNQGNGSVRVVGNGMVKSDKYCAIFNAAYGKITISDSAFISGTASYSNTPASGTVVLNRGSSVTDVILEISGGTIVNTGNGYAVYNAGNSRAIFSGGPAFLVGGYQAINGAPELYPNPDLRVVASRETSGEPKEAYKSQQFDVYRYLQFGPLATVAQNQNTGEEYYKLQTAVNAAQDGDTIALLDDITFADTINITLNGGKHLTLDLKGKKIDTNIVFSGSSGGKLTIDDTVGGGLITSSISEKYSGTIQASSSVADGAILEVKGGTVENTAATSATFMMGGNAIRTAGCRVMISGGTVKTSGAGAAIKTSTAFLGTVDVLSGMVKNTNQNGAAIYHEAVGTINVSGGTVDGGPSTAIVNAQTGKINISGTALVTGASAVQLSSGFSDRTLLEVSGGTVESTAAGETYAAIELKNAGVVHISGGVVRTTAAGGIVLRNHSNGKFVISGGTVENNVSGDAIYNTGLGAFDISGGRIHAQNGMALKMQAWGAEVVVTGGTISSTNSLAINIGSSNLRIKGGTTIIWGGETALYWQPDEIADSLAIFASTTDKNGADATERTRSEFLNLAETFKYIRFEPSYAVTYHPGTYGTGSQVTASKIHDVALTLGNALFTREGYTQTGWATTDGGAQAFELGGSYTANEAITLYPVWTPNAPNTYTVTYLPGTYGTGTAATDTKTHDVALTLRGVAFTREGYTQTGWATTDGGAQAFELGGSYTSNAAITLYPVWTPNAPNTYTVTYLPGTYGTGGAATDTKAHDVALTLRGVTFTREGYTQTGWATTDGGAQAFELGGSYTANEAITLYPVWTPNAPNTYTVTYLPGAYGMGSAATDTKAHDVALTLRGVAFTRVGYTQTGWAMTDGGAQAFELGGSYTANEAIALYPVWTPNAPNTYTVTYLPGTYGTGGAATDTKTHDVALTLRGVTFTRDGYTQTGWATTDGGAQAFELGGSYMANESTTLYPVWTQDAPAPGGSGGGSGGSTRPADTGTTVYNHPSETSATIWLSGSGLSSDDLLVTEAITSGSNYNAMLKLADREDILHIYDISLQSGKSPTGSAMYLMFDLKGQYAGQALTLVHKKADGTFEYFFATAGADGKVKFGPVYELSPFMLVKGSLLYVPTEEVINVPKTGNVPSPIAFALLALAALCGAGAVALRKKQA